MSIPIPAERHGSPVHARNDPRLVTHDQPVHLRPRQVTEHDQQHSDQHPQQRRVQRPPRNRNHQTVCPVAGNLTASLTAPPPNPTTPA